MRKTFVFSIILLTATLFAFAGSKARSLDISITDSTSVAGIQLKAGEYQVRINAEDTVATFYRNGSEVVKVTVHSQPSTAKFGENELIVTDATLKELHIGGTTTSLVIDGPAK